MAAFYICRHCQAAILSSSPEANAWLDEHYNCGILSYFKGGSPIANLIEADFLPHGVELQGVSPTEALAYTSLKEDHPLFPPVDERYQARKRND